MGKEAQGVAPPTTNDTAERRSSLKTDMKPARCGNAPQGNKGRPSTGFGVVQAKLWDCGKSAERGSETTRRATPYGETRS